MKNRKKMMKKFYAAIMMCMMVLSGTGLSADIHAQSQSLPEPGKTGSITIHKYQMETLPDPGTPANGLEAGTEGGPTIPDGATPLDNVKFTITKMKDGTTDVNSTEVDTTFGTNGSKSDITANGGIVSFKDLPQGVYKVHEEANSAVSKPAKDTLVSIPMTDPIDGNEWIYDVHIYPKNVITSTPVIEKSIDTVGNDSKGSNIGESVKWIITPTIADDMADSLKYDVTDKLDSRLDFVPNSVKVYAVSADGTKTEIKNDTTKYYNVTEPATKSGGTLVISFTAEGRKELAKALPATDTGIPHVEIEFETIVNATADMGTPIYNGATLDYTNALDQDSTTEVDPADQPEVHTGGLVIEKQDGKDEKIKLKGAEFKIATSKENAEAGIFVQKDGADWTVTTDEDGRASFSGLAYGDKGVDAATGSSTYWLVETVAPLDADGNRYNLLKEPLEVTVNATSHDVSVSVNNPLVIVKNNKGFTLPITGGAGTVMFLVVGISLISVAAGLLLSQNKKKKVQQ